MESCYFSKIGKCSCSDSCDLIKSGPQRIASIIDYSKQYGDNLYQELEENLQNDSNYFVYTHRACVSTYTSKQHISRFLKRKQQSEIDTSFLSQKKSRRSFAQDFDFKKHCLFCGETCNLEKDPKNPGRWRRAYLCRTIGESSSGQFDVKQEILNTCDARADKWSTEVRLRLLGAVSDLHAADARYHADCKLNFMSPKNIHAAAASTSHTSEKPKSDAAFDHIVELLSENESKIWNSVELFQMYVAEGGSILTRRLLIQSLIDNFGDKLLVLSAPGVASIIVFRHKAPLMLKLVNDTHDSELLLDSAINTVSNQIIKEVKSVEVDKAHYKTRIDTETVENELSSTLMRVLSKISKKLDYSPSAYLIGSIVTNTLVSFPTALQLALGVLMRNSKSLVRQLNAFGVTCTYDEVLRYKKSAAVAATSAPALQGISDTKAGLIQVVVDNFDADISSQNGKLSTHSLAVLVTQPLDPNKLPDSSIDNTIKRIDKTEMTKAIEYDLCIDRYCGPKKPQMPGKCKVKQVLPLKVLSAMSVSRNRARETDTCFINNMLKSGDCPEFNGFNTKNCREQGHGSQSQTKAMYLPLIDMTPSDPDTIITSLRQAQEITTKCGQDFVVYTGDLQLYKVAVNILWAYPEQFSNVILRLGGMHTLMSYVGSIGTLMAGSGLHELLESTFAGVHKMMSGKKFPQNVRALRLVAEELLRPLFSANDIRDFTELDQLLCDISSKSKTSKLWIDCTIRAVFIIMMYIRAEREGDWGLHLVAMKAMIPYFFAAGHFNYARYGLYYLRSMESMPGLCRDKFMKGEHVMRHVPGIWNGIWSDMYIETTFMRYGHGKRGIIGVTLKPETLKVWSLSLHICSRLEQDIDSLSESDYHVTLNKHKEETMGRIYSDKLDRDSIHRKLQECIDPLSPEQHPTEIVNIFIGKIAQQSVNVHRAVEIGLSQMNEFERGWPNSFHEKLSHKVTTQADSRRHIKVGDTKVFDTELIFSRVIGLQASSRDVDLKQLLSYELSPVPTSMFTEFGEMRVAKAKSALKKVLQKEVSARCVKKLISTYVIDGCAIFYVLNWPSSSGTVGDFVQTYREYIEKHLEAHDVYLVFDRYREFSTKSVTRAQRGAKQTRVHQLTSAMPIPPKEVIFTDIENKRQLIALIVDDLCKNVAFPKFVSENQIRRLVVTGDDPVPLEITSVSTIRREDMKTSHEEADNILAQQMVLNASQSDKGVCVISDDTDVFVLLLYFYYKHNLKGAVIMESPVKDRKTIDIRLTVNENKDIISDLPAAHALSGSDTTSCLYGIGKTSIVGILRTQSVSLSLVGDSSSRFEDVLKQATDFITLCYRMKIDGSDMSSVRQRVWASRVGKAPSCSPKLCSLPPTSESFQEHVKRAHLQASIWRHAADADPPCLDPERFGWIKNEEQKTLVPVMLPKSVSLAPENVLKLIKCSCESQSPCVSLRCTCNKARLSCTIFCSCQGSAICCNNQTKS